MYFILVGLLSHINRNKKLSNADTARSATSY